MKFCDCDMLKFNIILLSKTVEWDHGWVFICVLYRCTDSSGTRTRWSNSNRHNSWRECAHRSWTGGWNRENEQCTTNHVAWGTVRLVRDDNLCFIFCTKWSLGLYVKCRCYTLKSLFPSREYGRNIAFYFSRILGRCLLEKLWFSWKPVSKENKSVIQPYTTCLSDSLPISKLWVNQMSACLPACLSVSVCLSSSNFFARQYFNLIVFLPFP